MIDSQLAFNMLLHLYKESKSTEFASAPLNDNLILSFGVKNEDLNRYILFFLEKDLITIIKKGSIENNKTHYYYYLRDIGKWKLDDLFKSAEFIKHENEDKKLGQDAVNAGTDGLEPIEAHRLQNQWRRILDTFFNFKPHNQARMTEINKLYNETKASNSYGITSEIENKLLIECYYVYDVYPYNNYNDNLDLTKEYLLKLYN